VHDDVSIVEPPPDVVVVVVQFPPVIGAPGVPEPGGVGPLGGGVVGWDGVGQPLGVSDELQVALQLT